MQRCIRAVAERFGSIASFMPKPMENQAGNGMHLHCCLLDDEGNNVFDSGDVEGTVLLRHAVAGCLELMADTHLIFAPSFNAYRRFQAGNHAPTQPNWGYDNRTTALRIPAAPVSRPASSIESPVQTAILTSLSPHSSPACTSELRVSLSRLTRLLEMPGWKTRGNRLCRGTWPMPFRASHRQKA